MHDRGACMAVGVHGRGHTWQGVCGRGMHGRGGVHGREGMHGMGHTWQGCVWQGDMHCGGGMHGQGVCMAGDRQYAADGMHPTGMHSCFLLIMVISNIPSHEVSNYALLSMKSINLNITPIIMQTPMSSYWPYVLCGYEPKTTSVSRSYFSQYPAAPLLKFNF